MAKAIGIRLEVPDKQIGDIARACRALGDKEMPFLRAAMNDGLDDVARGIGARAPASFAVSKKGITVQAGGITGKGTVSHPGAPSREFGRTFYWAGYKGHNMKSGQKVKRAGQRAQPFIGIRDGGYALGAALPRLRAGILDAIPKEWDRISGGSA